MLVSILEKINSFNEFIFSPFDNLFQKLPFDDWVVDALSDSIRLLPFLFIIFVVIEILEFYFSDKINSSIKKAKKRSILISSLASIFPQCGFSVMASSLYSKKIITRGCLIAVFLGTSDECLPILLATPEKIHMVLPVVGVKFVIAIAAGYFLDFIWGYLKHPLEVSNETGEIHEQGCCNHDLETHNKRELILHPISHTVNVFAFILVITLILNYLFEYLSFEEFLLQHGHSYCACVLSGILGLIPNCAISIATTMMLIKGHISFGVAMSALLSNSGLGLLVLLKNNDFRDNLKIIAILTSISIVSGCLIEFIMKFRLN
ncbi:arsenic efflux protein [bacterium]|nr:arsenic efflux protein [bacterium]